jgi:hypothetical protein
MSTNFYDMYFKLKDMEVGSNVNDINSQNVDLTPIDAIDIGVRQDFTDKNDELQYTYDPEKGYVPNRPPKPGEVGYAPQGRIDH